MLRKYRFKYSYIVLILFVTIWRLALFLLSHLSPRLLKYQPSFPYYDSILPATGFPQWIYSWANFDGAHYLTIIEKGYIGTGLVQAFFPVFPWLIRIISLHAFSTLIVGLTINFLLLTSALLLFIKLLKTDEAKINLTTLLLVILLFPTSFFFASFYNEALFLCLVLATFLAARKRMWLISGLLTAVASATRVVGILLIPALIVELLLQLHEASKTKRPVILNLRVQSGEAERSVAAISTTLHKMIESLFTQKKELFYISLGSLGLLSYMWFLYGEFNDPFYFFSVQNEFGAERSTSLVLYPQVVWRYLKILATVDPFSWKYYSIIQEFIFGVGGLLLILYSFFKTRTSYVTFSLLAFIVPTLTGTFSSMPRYALVSFTIFIVIAQILDEKPRLKWVYYPLSAVLLILNTVLFIQGYWVS